MKLSNALKWLSKNLAKAIKKSVILNAVKNLSALILFIALAPFALAEAPLELQNAINEKAKALQAVTKQIQETQKNLIETEQKGKSLKTEINRLNYSLNQIDLGIRSSELTIEKLELEISALQGEISENESKSELKKATIRQLLKELQTKDNESALLSLLKNKTLSESVNIAQSILTFNGTLSGEVNALAEIKTILGEKLGDETSKKKSVENERGTLKVKKGLAKTQQTEKQQLLAQTKNQEKLYLALMTELEKKQQEISEEIEKIEEELRLKIDNSLLPSKRPGVLEVPVKGYLSQNFGDTPFARNGGYRGHFHNGIDIAAPIGTPIYAAEDGTIIKFGDQDRFCRKGAYGKFVVISHPNNLTTLYAHLSSFNAIVADGRVVKRGDIIGYVGKTGYATGPHLHFTVYSSLTFYMGSSRSCGPMPFGGYLNPIDYLAI